MAGSAIELVDRVRAAMGATDLDGFFELLAPDVRWGPPDDSVSGCINRKQVRRWWQKSYERGTRATVREVVAAGDHILVGLTVYADGEATERWQVLTVRDGLISDIRGFEERSEAAARAGATN